MPAQQKIVLVQQNNATSFASYRADVPEYIACETGYDAYRTVYPADYHACADQFAK